jgi:hypothetical protein
MPIFQKIQILDQTKRHVQSRRLVWRTKHPVNLFHSAWGVAAFGVTVSAAKDVAAFFTRQVDPSVATEEKTRTAGGGNRPIRPRSNQPCQDHRTAKQTFDHYSTAEALAV